MIYILLFVLVIALLLLPQWWIRRVMQRFSAEREDILGTGGQFAEHLIQRLELAVEVEESQAGDYYDPENKKVCLSEANFSKKSLAAIVIAAHEVGHAMQDQKQETLFLRRIQLAKLAYWVEKIAPLALSVSPLLLALTKSPLISFLTLLIGVLAIGLTTLVHVVTLPVELDASFNKALPLLEAGNYLPLMEDKSAARKLLKAAAYTYVAASLYNLLNVFYWLRLLRR